ncbi:hypothetical protein E7Z59_01275 [Robertkochia marina]|uniref:Uncharacterized protein n=1 Tax=Robertkochia marina TaxID=1227945 RepID=A0A4S3M2B6_9FLAO|nr:DUF6428 family protein [Robertkochia marina]THD68990.1 hypothetical protein E7Z59_01275 [Robertkochia marina]TRZ44812.1 hypothetical protein D3A96_07235 [Robertkochia marina]
MKLSEVKAALAHIDALYFELPDGSKVPSHFHVTEIGEVTRRFVDCGGTLRKQTVINFQLFTATDYDHRLQASKLKDIITLSEKYLLLDDHEVEVEYQGVTIEKYGLEFNGEHFVLTSKQTDCLAKEACGIPAEKPRVRLSELQAQANACEPGSGCC